MIAISFCCGLDEFYLSFVLEGGLEKVKHKKLHLLHSARVGVEPNVS